MPVGGRWSICTHSGDYRCRLCVRYLRNGPHSQSPGAGRQSRRALDSSPHTVSNGRRATPWVARSLMTRGLIAVLASMLLALAGASAARAATFTVTDGADRTVADATHCPA